MILIFLYYGGGGVFWVYWLEFFYRYNNICSLFLVFFKLLSCLTWIIMFGCRWLIRFWFRSFWLLLLLVFLWFLFHALTWWTSLLFALLLMFLFWLTGAGIGTGRRWSSVSTILSKMSFLSTTITYTIVSWWLISFCHFNLQRRSIEFFPIQFLHRLLSIIRTLEFYETIFAFPSKLFYLSIFLEELLYIMLILFQRVSCDVYPFFISFRGSRPWRWIWRRARKSLPLLK